jgi:cytochrome P450
LFSASVTLANRPARSYAKLVGESGDFDPERFAPGRSADRPRFADFPFGGGPHTCIGAEFAAMEAQLVLAMTLTRFRLELLGGHPIAPDPIFTLRPRGGVPLTIRNA